MSKKLYPNLCKRISLLITFIEKKYIIKRYIGERRKPKAWQIRSIGGHGVGIYFPRSYVAHLVDDARGKYFNKKNVAYVNSFSKQNKWNDVIIKYIEFLL